MTTLRYLYVDSVDCKTACTQFQIVKTLNAVNYVNMTFVKKLIDALITAPAMGDAVNIEVTCADATNVIEFIGDITKITPKGYYYNIEARAETRTLADQKYNGSFATSTVETCVETIGEDSTGLTYSNISGSSSGVTLTTFYGMNQDKLTLLKRLSDTSVSGANPMFVFYQDGATATTLYWDSFGRQATSITLAVGTAIIEPTDWRESVDELTNDVTVIFSGGTVRVTDSTSISTYGTHAKTIHAYYIDNATDADNLADKLLYDYKNSRILVKAKVRHDYLNTGTYYDVLNCTYSLTDATIGKSAAGPYTCIEHKINYPGFVDELTFGSVYQDATSYQKSLERRIQELERTRISIYASDTLRHSHDTEVTETSTSPVLKKTFTFGSGMVGSLHIKYDLKSGTGSEISCIFKKNGTTISGIGSAETSATYVTHTDDKYITFDSGDTLTAWLSVTSSGTAYLRNWRLHYDYSTSRTTTGVTTS